MMSVASGASFEFGHGGADEKIGRLGSRSRNDTWGRLAFSRTGDGFSNYLWFGPVWRSVPCCRRTRATVGRFYCALGETAGLVPAINGACFCTVASLVARTFSLIKGTDDAAFGFVELFYMVPALRCAVFVSHVNNPIRKKSGGG
jgi:hypothetical protein